MKSRISQNHWLLSHPIAHRGIFSNTTIPENSLPAFEKCVQQNVSIELDVHILKDGTLVIFHDEDLKRMTGCQGKISKFDKAQLSQCNLLNTSHVIPTLSEVLNLVQGKVPILIEIKNEGVVGKLEKALATVLKEYKGEYAIQSFNPYSLYWFKKHMPEVLRGQLSGDFRDSDIPIYQKLILKRFLLNTKSEPDFINFDIRALPNKKVQKLRKKGMPVLAWTIRSEEDAVKANQYADNYISELW